MKRKPFQASCFFARNLGKKMVAAPGIEPGTHGFSVHCSTDWAKLPHSFISGFYHLVCCIIYHTFVFCQDVFRRFFAFFHRYPLIFQRQCFLSLFAQRNFWFSKSNFVRFCKDRTMPWSRPACQGVASCGDRRMQCAARLVVSQGDGKGVCSRTWFCRSPQTCRQGVLL